MKSSLFKKASTPKKARQTPRMTLTRLLILLSSVTVLVYLASYSTISIVMEKEASEKELLDYGEDLQGRLAKSLSQPLWNYDPKTMLLTLNGEIDSKNIRSIQVTGRNDSFFLGLRRNLDGTVEEFGTASPRQGKSPYPLLRKDILYEGEVIGSLEIELTDEGRQEEFQGRLWDILLGQILSSLIIVVTLAVFFQLFIIRRLMLLKTALEDFGLRNLSLRTQIIRNDEIGDLGKQFNKMAATIETYALHMETQVKEKSEQLIRSEKLAMLGSLVAGVAHEMNTPLGICMTAASFIDSRVKKVAASTASDSLTKSEFDTFLKDMLEAAQIIDSNLNRANDLIKTFKGIGADQLSDEEREFFLDEYLSDTILSLQSQVKNRDIKIELACPRRMAVYSHPNAFFQIVSNLVMNSLKHGYPENAKGTIRIKVEIDEDEVRMIYRDDGVGIDPEILPKIFDPFYTTKRNEGNTGLGMYIVFTLVNRLRGNIKAASTPGKGCAFTLCFPTTILSKS